MTYPAPDHAPKDDWFSDPVPVYKDKEGNDIVNITPPAVEVHKPEEEITMHEKMYRIATARYNPFAIGGSENCHSDIDCPIGGSEKVWEHPHDSMPIATDKGGFDWEDTAPSEYEP